MKKSASCIEINPGVVLCVINQSTLVLARVHIIHKYKKLQLVTLDYGQQRAASSQ